jgi:hypothetical protein
MASLAGEFQTDLPLSDALAACAEALDGLGWHVESVDEKRIVSYASGITGRPPRVEVVLAGSDQATDIRLVGSDTEAEPLENDALVADLDRARDAIKTALELRREGDSSLEGGGGLSPADQVTELGDAARTEVRGAAPGWYPDAHGRSRLRYWDGQHWTNDYRPANNGPQPEAPQANETAPRFRSLRVIAGVYEFLAWCVAILGAVGVIAATVNANNETDTDPALVFVIGMVAVVFYVLFLFGIAAAIRLALAVEENTRATVELLRAQEENL